ncbi:hypothetical protein RI844_08305 [Thalassotalea fonticola]|uniref:Uncharacterized protein n=1 Tax=Thalassotalea fonticola TaxID=3065649 RepID=A0ABZ0GTB2_9GAMM|nr:hypothetical protein RI844_08305 [Colwelliaceae bacterium S1-1]
MEILLIYTSVVLVFSLTCYLFKVFHTFPEIFSTITQSFKIISNSQISDDRKELASKEASKQLFILGLTVLIKFLLVITISAIPYLISNHYKIITEEEFYTFSLRYDVILISIIAVLIFTQLLNKLKSK